MLYCWSSCRGCRREQMAVLFGSCRPCLFHWVGLHYLEDNTSRQSQRCEEHRCELMRGCDIFAVTAPFRQHCGIFILTMYIYLLYRGVLSKIACSLPSVTYVPWSKRNKYDEFILNYNVIFILLLGT